MNRFFEKGLQFTNPLQTLQKAKQSPSSPLGLRKMFLYFAISGAASAEESLRDRETIHPAVLLICNYYGASFADPDGLCQ